MALRPVDVNEKAALRFTFARRIAPFLIDNIKIGEGEGESNNENEILLPRGYVSANLDDLGKFIYKATRIWQQNTDLYHQRQGEESYRYTQLYELAAVNDRQHGSLNLNGMQHAAAVRDWFYVSYGRFFRLIGTGKNRMPSDTLWGIILHVLGISLRHKSGFGNRVFDLQQIVNNHYGCVIKEIQRDRVGPALLAGIKDGQGVGPVGP